MQLEFTWVLLACLLVAICVIGRILKREREERSAQQVEQKRLANLEEELSAALLPDPTFSTGDLNRDIAAAAQKVLDHLVTRADDSGSGYRSLLRMTDYEDETDRNLIRRILTAGTAANLVRWTDDSPKQAMHDSQYLLHSDFVKALSRLRARMLLATSSTAAQVANSAAARDRGRLGQAVPEIGQPQARAQLVAPANRNPPQPRAVDAYADLRSPNNVTDQTLSVFGDDISLNRELVEHFAGEMGQQVGTIEYLMRHTGQIDVQRLWATMDLVLRHDDAGLRSPLTKAMKSVERSVDDARRQFPSNLMAVPGALGKVNDFADRLKSMTVVMVMLPGAAYDNLINKMDAEVEEDKCAGRLTPALAEKHRIIVRHRSELARAEYSEDHWDAVMQSLLKFHNGLETIAADRPPTRMA